MRILVVDDVQMSLYQVEKAVRPFGEVIAHKDPLQALTEFKACAKVGQPFDLVFLDISMPAMDGLEFLLQLRETEREFGLADHRSRVVMVTSHSEQDFVAKAIQKGAQGYLLKPIVPEKLHAEIHRLFPEGLEDADQGRPAKAS
jgi:two-component system, chemotaxis family, chemotaxis protein CheY